MGQRAPSKYYRKSIPLAKLFQMFPDDKTAEQWFISERWPDGIRCPYCESDRVNEKAKHPTMPFRCNACKETVLGQVQVHHAQFKARLPDLGDCDLPGSDQLEGALAQ